MESVVALAMIIFITIVYIDNLWEWLQDVTMANYSNGYLTYKKNANYREVRIGDIRDSRLDNTEIKSKTSWIPKYSLSEGLKEYSEQ